MAVGRRARRLPRLLPGRRRARCAAWSRRRPTSLELMRSYAADVAPDAAQAALPGRRAVHRAGAASWPPPASVIGVVVAEISTGLRGGIGRLIIEYARQATGDPAKVYTARLRRRRARAGDGRRSSPSLDSAGRCATDRQSRRTSSVDARERGRGHAASARCSTPARRQPGRRARRRRPHRRAGRVRLADRAVGLRQVDAAAADRQPHRADDRRRRASTASRPHQARLDQDYGMAFQQAGLFEWRSVVKNIELPLELKGWDKAAPAPAGDGDARSSSSSATSPSTGRGSCRAACSSASRSPGRSPPTRRCC